MLLFSVVQKWVFRPAVATHYPDKREISPGGADLRSAALLHAKFHVYRKKCGNTAPKSVIISILVINLCFRSNSFALILRNSEHLYTLMGTFYFLVWSLSGDRQLSYKHFLLMGAFSHKFSIVSSGVHTFLFSPSLPDLSSLLLLSPFPPVLSIMSFLLCCEANTLNTAGGLWERCKLPPAGSGAESRPQSQFSRLITGKRKFDHIIDTLLWSTCTGYTSPPTHRIQVVLTISKCQRRTAPSYLADMTCIPVSAMSSRTYRRSAIHCDLVVPRTRLARYHGPRSFAVSGPATWNSLQCPLISATCLYPLPVSSNQLQTELFIRAYYMWS